jgi:hypothetical protein
MIYGYARVSTDGQSVDAQVAELKKHGAGQVFREVASGARSDRPQLLRLIDALAPGDVVTVTRLDRLARSTRDLLNTLAAITEKKKSDFRSIGDAWADTTTPHGRLMLTVLGWLGGVRERIDPGPHQRGPGTRQAVRRQARAQTEADPGVAARSDQEARRGRGNAGRNREALPYHDFTTHGLGILRSKRNKRHDSVFIY